VTTEHKGGGEKPTTPRPKFNDREPVVLAYRCNTDICRVTIKDLRHEQDCPVCMSDVTLLIDRREWEYEHENHEILRKSHSLLIDDLTALRTKYDDLRGGVEEIHRIEGGETGHRSWRYAFGSVMGKIAALLRDSEKK